MAKKKNKDLFEQAGENTLNSVKGAVDKASMINKLISDSEDPQKILDKLRKGEM